MKSQYIRSILVLLIGLSACAPTESATPTPIDSPTLAPTAIPSETSGPTDTPIPVPSDTPVPTPVPFVKITDPVDNGTLSCDNPPTEPFCLFHVQGNIGGIDSFLNYQVYLFVFPVDPPGEGWYLQKTPAAIDSNGDWEQLPAYLGNEVFQATTGDTLKIRAVLVKADATLNDTQLDELVQSNDLIVLPDVTAIVGLVAISDIVDLTLSR